MNLGIDLSTPLSIQTTDFPNGKVSLNIKAAPKVISVIKQAIPGEKGLDLFFEALKLIRNVNLNLTCHELKRLFDYVNPEVKADVKVLG